eukprot:COSAG04_NODE_915_length_9438_cov_28.362351_3_plen_371_part_00
MQQAVTAPGRAGSKGSSLVGSRRLQSYSHISASRGAVGAVAASAATPAASPPSVAPSPSHPDASSAVSDRIASSAAASAAQPAGPALGCRRRSACAARAGRGAPQRARRSRRRHTPCRRCRARAASAGARRRAPPRQRRRARCSRRTAPAGPACATKIPGCCGPTGAAAPARARPRPSPSGRSPRRPARGTGWQAGRAAPPRAPTRPRRSTGRWRIGGASSARAAATARPDQRGEMRAGALPALLQRRRQPQVPIESHGQRPQHTRTPGGAAGPDRQRLGVRPRIGAPPSTQGASTRRWPRSAAGRRGWWLSGGCGGGRARARRRRRPFAPGGRWCWTSDRRATRAQRNARKCDFAKQPLPKCEKIGFAK